MFVFSLSSGMGVWRGMSGVLWGVSQGQGSVDGVTCEVDEETKGLLSSSMRFWG